MTVGCLILHQRYQKRYARYLSLAQDVATSFDEQTQSEQEAESSNALLSDDINAVPSTSNGGTPSKSPKCGNLPTIKEGYCEDSPIVDIEDIVTNRRSSKGVLKSLMPDSDDV